MLPLHIVIHRDKKILLSVFERINNGESSLVIGMTGSGSELLYQELIQHMDINLFPYAFFSINADSESEFSEFIHDAMQIPEPVCLVINNNLETDIVPLLKKLERHRISKPHEFLYVVFSEIKPLLTTIETVSHDLVIPVLPLSVVDSEIFVSELAVRLKLSLSKKEKNEIFVLSGGNIQLMKLICGIKYHEQKLNISTLLRNRGIRKLLSDLIEEIGNETALLLALGRPTPQQTEFLTRFGYISHRLIFSELLSREIHEIELKFDLAPEI